MAEYVCADCGRTMELREGMVDGKTYCHPFDLPLNEASCYMRASWRQTFARHYDEEMRRLFPDE